MGRWGRLTERLAHHDDRVRFSWGDLEALVGPLPASATNHRAWWSGDRPHVRAWRDAGFALGGVAPGVFVEFVRADVGSASPGTRRSSRVADCPRDGSADDVIADLLLVSCVKKKRSVPAFAKDLYISPLFVAERRYAEARAAPWYILSAKYGLVGPEEWIEPYALYLPDTTATYRSAWGKHVVDRLVDLTGPLDGVIVEIHARRTYLDAVSGPLRTSGGRIVAPLSGLPFGARLSWYKARTREA
jgi:hypothetical protein